MSELVPTIKILPTHPESQGDFVEINASDFDEAKHERFIEPPPEPVAPPPPPPPPGPPDPLATLPKDWRKVLSAEQLRNVAAAISEGRMPETKEQAVEIITAAFDERKPK